MFTLWSSAFVDDVSRVTAAFLNKIRIDVSRAIDGTGGGGPYTPADQIEIGGDGLLVSGPFEASGTTTLSGTTTIDGATVSGNLAVTGNTSLTGTLTVADDVTLNDPLVCNDLATFNQDTTFNHPVACASTLDVTGTATLAFGTIHNATIDTNLDATGAAVDFSGALSIAHRFHTLTPGSTSFSFDATAYDVVYLADNALGATTVTLKTSAPTPQQGARILFTTCNLPATNNYVIGGVTLVGGSNGWVEFIFFGSGWNAIAYGGSVSL